MTGHFTQGYQHLADRILQSLRLSHPNNRFLVVVTKREAELMAKSDHTFVFNQQYNHAEKFTIAVQVAFDNDDDDEENNNNNNNTSSTLLDCFENQNFDDYWVDNNCQMNAHQLLEHIRGVCGDIVIADDIANPNAEATAGMLDMVGVVRDSELGLASTLPANAFSQRLMSTKSQGCAGTGNSDSWRIFIALRQNYELAEPVMLRKLVQKLTRIRSLANAKFVSAQNCDDENNNNNNNNNSLFPLIGYKERVDSCEQFLVLRNPDDGTVSLQLPASADTGDDGTTTAFVVFSDSHGQLLVGSNQQRQMLPPNHGRFYLEKQLTTIVPGSSSSSMTLRSKVTGNYVRIDSSNGVLVADRETDANNRETAFEFSSALSGLSKGENVLFPSPINAGHTKISNALFATAIFVMIIEILAVTALLILLALLCKFGADVRGSFGLQLRAFWSLRVRRGLDRMLDSTTVDNEKLLYSGPNSRVYLGRFRWAADQVRLVAVKVPSKEAFRMDTIAEETRINARLQHPRIVRYLGYFRDAFGDLRIVSEFMAGGDLHSLLARRDNALTTGHVLNFAGQIAEGMQYLASRHIVHRDLAARNCMLTDDRTAVKIADFGLSRRHSGPDANYTSTSPVQLPIRWTAPECLGPGADILPNAQFSEKSDIWSFGVVLWECFSRGDLPYGTAEELPEVLVRLRAGWRLPRPEPCPPPLYDLLMLKCWEARPELRPDFTAAIQLVELIFGQLVAQTPELLCQQVWTDDECADENKTV